MKKNMNSLLFVSALTVFSGSALADYTGPGSVPVTDVAAISKTPVDEMQVVLVGRVTQRLSEESYLFTDGTGSIQIEIDDENLPAGQFDENTQVKIYAEVDAGIFEKAEIEVEQILII